MSDSGDNTIGGTTAGAGNVISANKADGILIDVGDRRGQPDRGEQDRHRHHRHEAAWATRPTGSDLFDESGNTIGGTTARRGQRHLGQRRRRDQHRLRPRQQQRRGRELHRHRRRRHEASGQRRRRGLRAGLRQHDRRDGGGRRQHHRLQRPGRRGGGGQLQRPDHRGGDPVEFDLRQPGAGDRPGRRRRHAQPPGGPIPGPNNYQNFPVLLAAVTYNGQTYIKGTLNSAADTSFTVQFFADPTADPSGYGQGQTYLGQATVTTDANRQRELPGQLPDRRPGRSGRQRHGDRPDRRYLRVRRRHPGRRLRQADLAVNDQYHIDLNTTLTVPAPGVQANDLATNGQPFSSVVVTGPSDGTLTLNSDGAFTYTPNTNFVGTDTFTYKDVQGSTVSNVATVTIDGEPQDVYTVTNTNDSGPGSLRAGHPRRQPRHQRPARHDPLRHPRHRPVHDRPADAPADPDPRHDHRRLQPAAVPRPIRSTSGDNAVIEIQLSGGNVPGADGLDSRRRRQHGGGPVDHRLHQRHPPHRHHRRRPGRRRLHRR